MSYDRNSDPRRPTGTTPEAAFDQFTHAQLNPPRRQLPARVKQFPVLTTSAQCYRVISEAGDYVMAEAWNGAAIGVPVPIAKDFLLQQSRTARTIYGVVITYTYAGTAPLVRTATPAGGSAIAEVISPAYAPGDLIYPERVSFSGVVDVAGNPITLMDTKTARVWATQPE